MIPHHQQATEMAAMAEGRSQSTEVLDLAEQIEAAQGPEIEVMTGLLEEWDVEADGAEMDHTDMGHGSSGGMEGMMSDEEMDALDQSSGPEFDQMFLTMMIEHHQGAVEMAEDEQANGQNDDALELAGQIATSQTAEIDVMRALLAQ
ncbi:DUF305 domain-containing protein [Nocardioides sp. ChNu-99]|nr:DUF305 domain-containing protein [Nocardioides sp. ChNu-99]